MLQKINSTDTTFMTTRLKQACIAFVTVAVSAIVLSLSSLPSHAQQGPFSTMSGSWSGRGNITLSSGSRERIQCRATYDTQSDGNDLRMALRCANDSYNYDFHGSATHSDGKLTGSWTESSKQTSGQFSGVIKDNQVAVRADAVGFTVYLNMTTQGNRQEIVIRSAGSEISEVAISLSRR